MFITRTLKMFDDKMLLSIENENELIVNVGTGSILNVQHIRKSLHTFDVDCMSRGYSLTEYSCFFVKCSIIV